jgi:hypothetical protein
MIFVKIPLILGFLICCSIVNAVEIMDLLNPYGMYNDHAGTLDDSDIYYPEEHKDKDQEDTPSEADETSTESVDDKEKKYYIRVNEEGYTELVIKLERKPVKEVNGFDIED